MTSRISRNFDGPDALPLGTATRHLAPAQVPFYGEATDLVRAQEIFRTRTRSELYEDWHVDQVLDGLQALARATHRLAYDCTRCKGTWLVTETDTTCPIGHRITD